MHDILRSNDTTDKALTKKQSIKKITVIAVAAAVAVIGILFKNEMRALFTMTGLESVYTMSERYPLSIYFPSIGNAGGAVIRTSDGIVLIDCGHEKAQSSFDDILRYLNADTIDIAVLTHPDSDHIGSFPEIVDKYAIKTFVTCDYSAICEAPLYETLDNALHNADIPIMYAHAGDVLHAGEIELNVLSPDHIYSTSNDNSVVIRLIYGDFSALFTGDISKKAEKDILASGCELRSDLLYVAHHGSSGSSSEEFLRAVSPDYAVISTQGSTYLPGCEAIYRLMECGCTIYRTDISGDIAVFTDGTKGNIEITVQN